MTTGSVWFRPLSAIAAVATLLSASVSAQQAPRLAAGGTGEGLTIDGVLAEPAWGAAAAIDAFTQTEPSEGAPPSGRTTVRVLADAGALVIGVMCEDAAPDRIVSFSVRRDADLEDEDHVRIVLGPFLDGRSGYVFAINPAAARYDALIAPGGEDENPDWDGIWQAGAKRLANGWSAEVRIPIQSLAFKPGLREWHFNVERRVQRLLETARWASPERQYELTQTSRAGLLTDLPEFDVGLGLSVRPAMTLGGGVPAPAADLEREFQPSLDVTQRLAANVTASLTVNTDFAETEVDTRRTNLTRFPLFFPEKRTFFLEGADIFSFGLGLGEDVIPFFSRRIGLVEGVEVPIIAGGKINGRLGDTNVGGLVVGTDDVEDVTPEKSLMTAWRARQNVWRESWVGAIVTTGDPLGHDGSWLAGADFTYATSRFRSDKNLLIGVWGLATGRRDLGRDATAHGFRIDYPNDLWDVALTYKRIGRDFDPSLGFVPRRAVQLADLNMDYSPRPSRGPIQEMSFEFVPAVAVDLSGRWESYQVVAAPVGFRFRSGDQIDFNVAPTGERLTAPFEVADVVIPPGRYHWRRYQLEAGTAQKRRFSSEVTWEFGGFYDGTLDQIEWSGAWNPTALVTVEFTGERHVGRLSTGDFDQTLVGNRLRLNLSPDLSFSGYVQYDTDSDSVGVNTRVRWTFAPAGDLFIVYNHNVRELEQRWQRESNQLLVKVQYAFRR